jgi:hypothetical protein
MAPRSRPMADSPRQLPPPAHGGAQQNALSGSYVSGRRTNRVNNARGHYNRRQASSFRRREQNVIAIKLVDDQGQTTRDVRYGSMATTSHVSVLNAVTERSN